jgi:hypothetical protein
MSESPLKTLEEAAELAALEERLARGEARRIEVRRQAREVFDFMYRSGIRTWLEARDILTEAASIYDALAIAIIKDLPTAEAVFPAAADDQHDAGQSQG